MFKRRHNVVIFFLKVESKPFHEYLGHITGYGLQKQLVRRVVKWNIVFISPKALFYSLFICKWQIVDFLFHRWIFEIFNACYQNNIFVVQYSQSIQIRFLLHAGTVDQYKPDFHYMPSTVDQYIPDFHYMPSIVNQYILDFHYMPSTVDQYRPDFHYVLNAFDQNR